MSINSQSETPNLAADYLLRKAAAILLFACLSLSICGYVVVFRIRLVKAKAEMKANLQANKCMESIEEFSFSLEEIAQLKWEHDKEFFYNGTMYDVVEKQVQGNRILIHCIADEKETILLRQYQKAVEKSNSSQQQNTLIAKLITANFLSPGTVHLSQPETSLKQSFAEYKPELLLLPQEVITPPPNLL